MKRFLNVALFKVLKVSSIEARFCHLKVPQDLQIYLKMKLTYLCFAIYLHDPGASKFVPWFIKLTEARRIEAMESYSKFGDGSSKTPYMLFWF